MYLLYKSRPFESYGTGLFLLKEAETLEELSKEVSKQIKDGYPQNTLHVRKKVDFDVDYQVDFKES